MVMCHLDLFIPFLFDLLFSLIGWRIALQDASLRNLEVRHTRGILSLTESHSNKDLTFSLKT